MYKHILLPTDGSELSAKAVAAGVQLAKALGARVTGLHVAPNPPSRPLENWAHGDKDYQQHLKALLESQAAMSLEVIKSAAQQAGVECECGYVWGDSPYEKIIEAARKGGCDLIFMACHGKKGAAAVVLGSETVKVLTHSPVPVLAYR